MLKADFHMHTSYSPDSLMTPFIHAVTTMTKIKKCIFDR